MLNTLHLQESTLYPTFRIGPFALSSYTILLDLGLLVGALLIYLRARRRHLNVVKTLDTALAAAMGGLFAARLAYVAVHWTYYQNHVRQALRPWRGGLAWQGALVGGLLTMAILCAIQRTSLLTTLNVLAPSVATLAICAWLACLLSGCAYGIETYPGQGVLWSLSLDLPDLYGIWAPRVAVQLLGAAWGTVALGVIILAERSRRGAPLAFPLWLTVYSLGAFGMGFARADETLFIAGYRLDQVGAMMLAIVGIAIALYAALKKKQRGGIQ